MDSEPGTDGDAQAEGASGGNDGDSGDTDGGFETDTGDDEPLPECPAPDGSVTAGFVVSIDREPVVIDYSEHSAPAPFVPLAWNIRDSEPEIDSTCVLTEMTTTTLGLECDDTTGIQRSISIDLMGSEALSTNVGTAAVHFWYMAEHIGDMLEANPDTIANSFVVSNDEGVVLAGIDGRYAAINAFMSTAWPSPLSGSNGGEPCSGATPTPGLRTMATIGVGAGQQLQSYDGTATNLGEYRALIERSTTERSPDPLGEEGDVHIGRWLLGRPG
ncbi:MAG: hypothetical protein AAF799_10960 [Myxococcota bacterium]